MSEIQSLQQRQLRYWGAFGFKSGVALGAAVCPPERSMRRLNSCFNSLSSSSSARVSETLPWGGAFVHNGELTVG